MGLLQGASASLGFPTSQRLGSKEWSRGNHILTSVPRDPAGNGHFLAVCNIGISLYFSGPHFFVVQQGLWYLIVLMSLSLQSVTCIRGLTAPGGSWAIILFSYNPHFGGQRCQSLEQAKNTFCPRSYASKPGKGGCVSLEALVT